MKNHITPKLAGYIAGTGEPPVSARQMMRLSLLDWAACGLAGQIEPVSRIIREHVTGDRGVPEASVIGTDVLLPAKAAALVNATTSHALDYDDTHFAHIGHPSVAVIPAALAIAEKIGAEGAAFLDAALIGAETSIRAGIWLGRSHYQAGFHQTATAGTIGAAAAACRLLQLSVNRTSHALGLAATRASGLKSQFGTMGKPYNAGIAASNGVEVALLGAAGFVSNPLALETDQGFGPTHAGQDDMLAFDGLGQDYLFETISHKFHACCHGLHAALEAMEKICDRIDPESVANVTITTHPRWMTVCNIAEPKSGLEAKFSYRLTGAMALTRQDTGALNTYSDRACLDANLVRLRNKISVRTDVGISETAASVVVDLQNGASLTTSHDLNGPLDIAMREKKLRAKASSIVGTARTGLLWDCITAPDGPDLNKLTDILRQ